MKIIMAFLVLANCLHFQLLKGQSPGMNTDAIDSIFKPWANRSGPGCSVVVVRGDSIIYAKGFGLSNIAYGVPLTAETPFYVASVSKQFTAYSILELSGEGKLDLDDDIRQYLSWFPDLHQKISIRQLLVHTSGIRTADQLLGIAGTRLDDVVTQEDMIKVLGRQRGLNFPPGTQYSYSNSNYLLLAEIVKAVTGKTLRAYTDSAIFLPLGMKASHFHDRYNEIEPGLAVSYYRNGRQGYSDAPVNSGYVGPTGLYSSATDLARWAMFLMNPKTSDSQTIRLMTEPGYLNDCTILKSAPGIEVDRYNGQIRYSHSGSQGGYHTFVSMFPLQKLGIIVLGNVEDFKPQRSSEQIADLFIPRITQPQLPNPVSPGDTMLAVLKDDHIKHYLGDYVSDDGTAFRVAILDQKLKLLYEGGGAELLTPVSKDTFAAFGHPEVRYIFSKDARSGNVIDQYWPGRSRQLVAYDARPTTDEQLQQYTGIYYSDELHCSYLILLKNHQLVLSGDKGDDIPLKRYGNDRLMNNTWFMPNMFITRDKKKNIIGFEVNSDRVMHLWFKKQLR